MYLFALCHSLTVAGSNPSKYVNVSREYRKSEVIETSRHALNEELPDFISDPETSSIRYSSSEDLGLADETISNGYASLTILPTSSRNSPVSPDLNDSVDYAIPLDYVSLGFNVRRQQRRSKKALTPSPPIPEEKRVSAYESIEDILKEKQKQQQKYETERQLAVSPSSLDEDQSEDSRQQQSAGALEEPIYSRPFDSIAGIHPLQVTKSKVALQPLRRSLGNEKHEKAAKSIHQTNTPVRDKTSQPRDLSYSPESSSPISPDDGPRRYVAAKGRSQSAKHPWRLRDSTTGKLPNQATAPFSRNKSTTDLTSPPQPMGKLPQLVIELEKDVTKSTNIERVCSPEPEWRGDIGRVASEGSTLVSPFGVKLRSANARKTGQAKLINHNELKTVSVTEFK